MDIRLLFTDLKESKAQYETVQETQLKVEKQLVAEEVKLLKIFAKPLFDIAETTEVHGEEALLIYTFKSKEKTHISPDVYLSTDWKVKYRVYDEASYRKFRHNAWIIDGWNIMDPEEFLQYVPLEKIFDFFNERPNELYKLSESFVEFNKSRKEFIGQFKALMSKNDL